MAKKQWWNVRRLSAGRWEIKERGSCGHETFAYLDDEPTDAEVVSISRALKEEDCVDCAARRMGGMSSCPQG